MSSMQKQHVHLLAILRAAVCLQSRMRPNSPAVGGTPVSVPRLRQTAAKNSLLHAHSRAAAVTGNTSTDTLDCAGCVVAGPLIH